MVTLLSILIVLNCLESALTQTLLGTFVNQTGELEEEIYVIPNKDPEDAFWIKHPLCCTPPKLFNATQVSSVNFQFDSSTQPTPNITRFDVEFSGHEVTVSHAYDESTAFINFTCQDSSQGSGLVRNTIGFVNENSTTTIKFAFWYRCESQDFTPVEIDWSQLILIFLICSVILVMARYSKIISVMIPVSTKTRWIVGSDQDSIDQELVFQGIKVTYWLFLIYLFGAIIFYLVFLLGGRGSYDLFLGLTSSVALIFGITTTNEILCSFSANFHLKTQVFRVVRVCDILSVVIASALIAIYLTTAEPWILSDVLSLFIVCSILKLFKVTSLKDGAIFLGLCLLWDIIEDIIINSQFKQNYQQYVLKYENYPFLLQIPTITDSFEVKCSWFSMEDIILPGFVLCYFYRYDTNRNSRVYTIISMSGLILGIVSWIIASYFASLDQKTLPQSVFVFPFVVVGTSLWAVKQGDFKQLWIGHFYDKAILEPLAQVIQNASLSETELDPQIFRGLNESTHSTHMGVL